MSKGPWRTAVERALGRSDVTNPGQGRGNHGHANDHISRTVLGITERQQEILEAYSTMGAKAAAAHLGIHKNSIYDIMRDIADRWGFDEGAPSGAVLDTYADLKAESHVGSTENYDDITVEGGDHPWLYDSEGNYIG